MAPNNFHMIVDRHDGVVVITPTVRELTFKNSKDFLAQAKNLLDAPGLHVVLNLENVEIIDSMSLGTLMALLKHLRKLGGDLVVAALSEPIRELFKLLNFTSVFRCFTTVEKALEQG